MEFFSKKYHPTGTPPGTLGRRTTSAVASLRLVAYSADELVEKQDVSPADVEPYLADRFKTWVHVEGHPDDEVLAELGALLGIHALALEDITNSGQRPKAELYADALFVIASMPVLDAGTVKIEQVSFVVRDQLLVSFCGFGFARFESVLTRLRGKTGRLRTQGVDFLMYTLLDIVIDEGFPVLEEFGAQLESLEAQVLDAASQRTLEQLHTIKREIILLRRVLWPQRDVINKLLRDEYEQVSADTYLYLRDCYDHTVQILEILETYREMTSGMLDIYLSMVSNRTNEIMRVLTVIATIFIPLTFITGVYGMNFNRDVSKWNMPELDLPYGYVVLWLIMGGLVAAMFAYFRKRNWF